eukprot:11865715-Alexandrium_andersonii.AAC.1
MRSWLSSHFPLCTAAMKRACIACKWSCSGFAMRSSRSVNTCSGFVEVVWSSRALCAKESKSVAQ